MQIHYGLISADSHGQLGKEAFLKRMSSAKWGDFIPHIAEVTDKASNKKIERWMVHGQIVKAFGACNCPAVMPASQQKYYPQRWEEVPRKVYEPLERVRWSLKLKRVPGTFSRPRSSC
jgi:hypothetical protein